MGEWYYTNKISCFKYLSDPKATNKSSKLLFKLRNKSDLVVVFDKVTDKDALNESYLARIPVISLNCDLNLLKKKINLQNSGFNFTKKST
jgi:ribosomal protein S2